MPKGHLTLIAPIALLAALAPAGATVTRRPFGTTPDGQQVEGVTLTGPRGISATILTYGTTIQSLRAPDRAGKVADVVLDSTATRASPARWRCARRSRSMPRARSRSTIARPRTNRPSWR